MALEFPFPEPPPGGACIDVASGIQWLRMPLPMRLDHINLYLLDEGDGWTIVDTGLGTKTTQKHWEQIFEDCLDGRPVKRIVVTHMHPDHVGQGRLVG